MAFREFAVSQSRNTGFHPRLKERVRRRIFHRRQKMPAKTTT
jgi:hypothetical protein